MPDDLRKVLDRLTALSDESVARHDATIATFETGLRRAVSAMRTRVIALLSSGELDPKNAARARSLITLQTELQGQLNAAGYHDFVKELIGSYDASIESAIEAVKAMRLPADRLAPLDRNALRQLKNVDYDYLAGLGTEAINAVGRTLIQNAVLGSAPAQFLDQIVSTLDTRLKNYASTYAITALVVYDRTVAMDIWQSAGIKQYVFRGPEDIKNRPLCAKYGGKVLTIVEIEKLNAEAAAASKTPLLPVLRYGFGWGCRHVWSPWP